MKKEMKKTVSLLTTAALCSTFSFFTVFAAENQSISLGKMNTVYSKGNTAEINLIQYDANGNEDMFDDYDNCIYSSSDENVVSVTTDGIMTMEDYGVSTVTVNYGDSNASMLVTVTPRVNVYEGFNSNTSNPTERGIESKAVTVEKVEYGRDDNGAVTSVQKTKIGSLYWGANPKLSNLTCEAWFYDNGKTEDSEAGIGFKRHENYNNTGAVGIINAADTTYKISKVHDRWDEIWSSDMTNAEDTGIKRTPGWHQVTIVQTNAEGKVISGSEAMTTEYRLYLDGTLIRKKQQTKMEKYQIYGYAGMTIGHTAYFDDAVRNAYASIENINITKNSDGALNADYTYYGETGSENVNAVYQWYSSEDKNNWTAIDGANEKTYQDIKQNTYYKLNIKITDTVAGTEITIDKDSESYYNIVTAIRYENNKVYVDAGENITGILIVAKYDVKGEYKSLVSVNVINDVNVAEGDTYEIALPDGFMGQDCVIMLWDGLNTQRSLCEKVEL